MLVLKRLVDAYVIVAPTEMRCCRWFYTGAGTSCDCIYRYIALKKMFFGKRKQGKLYAGGKASGVGYVTSLAGVATVKFG